MPAEAVILDGYVDEPACLGVPPYISPYIRAIAGLLKEERYQPRYLTIDQLRQDPGRFAELRSAGLVVMIAGVTVPGKYLGGTPATLTEIRQIGSLVKKTKAVIGGPIGFGYAAGGGSKAVRQAIGGFSALLRGSPAEALSSYLAGGEPEGTLDYARNDAWCREGAGIITQHPSFPYVMCEIETARGCSRQVAGGCSFCTEPFYGPPVYRPLAGITEETRALHAAGARHFRLGRQPDILTYQAGGGEFPVPVPEMVDALFTGVRAAAPDLRTLHIDNVNPGTIARHEEAAREALAAIVRNHTPGDVAAFGMETADPAVIAANNLKAGPDEVFRAIEVVNEEGGARRDGIPELLPGLNFILGLAGETPLTYELNGAFLARVLAAGLSVRRVNIRQLMPFEGTRAYTENTLGKYDQRFRKFKEAARNNFDLPMLRRVFPVGTVLREVVIETGGDTSFGRQMGSYPILAGFPLPLPVRTVTDAVIVDWGMRSVTVLPVPVNINTLPASALRWLPGVGKKNVAAIIAKRPFKDGEAYRKIAGTSPLDSFLTFG